MANQKFTVDITDAENEMINFIIRHKCVTRSQLFRKMLAEEFEAINAELEKIDAITEALN